MECIGHTFMSGFGKTIKIIKWKWLSIFYKCPNNFKVKIVALVQIVVLNNLKFFFDEAR